MRRILKVAVILALCSSIGAAWAVGGVALHEQDYRLRDPAGVARVDVKEIVYDEEDTQILLGSYVGAPDHGYLYTYTVHNVSLDPALSWGVYCWGYKDEPYDVIWSRDEADWTEYYDCAWNHGDWGWIDDTPTPVANTNIPACTSQTFWYVSTSPPYALFDAFAHTIGGAGGTGGAGEYYATGKISGPTPEPVTVALLALGLPLGLLARRRRKED